MNKVVLEFKKKKLKFKFEWIVVEISFIWVVVNGDM